VDVARFVVALILSSLYAGVILLVAGVRPANGFPLWFFAPGVVAMLASIIAQVARRLLPPPWIGGETGGDPPRAVQLSWYAAFRLSGYVPLLFFPWYILSIMGMHFDIRLAWSVCGVLLLALFAHGVRRSVREVALLREGAVTRALVEQTDRERSDLIHVWYHFEATAGHSISGHAWRPEPAPHEGGYVPVYFDVSNPRRHVIAGASWFEAA
jgi:hypothetical protein